MKTKDPVTAKRKYLSGFCSANVINSILYDDLIPGMDKPKALQVARQLAQLRGSYRVYIDDWEKACRVVEEERLNDEANDKSKVSKM